MTDTPIRDRAHVELAWLYRSYLNEMTDLHALPAGTVTPARAHELRRRIDGGHGSRAVAAT